MVGRDRPPTGDRPRRLTTREAVPAPTTDLSARVAAIQARVGAAPVQAPVEASAGVIHPDQAVALVGRVLGGVVVARWEDHGDAGWVDRVTGEVGPAV